MTSSLLVADLKGNLFGKSIYLPSIIAMALLVLEIWKGWGEAPLGHTHIRRKKQNKKKPVIDRVKGDPLCMDSLVHAEYYKARQQCCRISLPNILAPRRQDYSFVRPDM